MTLSQTYCDQRVRAATEAAGLASLVNVRERELRSAAAWQAMSDRIKKLERSRAAKERERIEVDQLLATQSDDQPG